jgi:hypothetical protein
VKKPDANRPDTPYEAASYDLKEFRERRIADRRFIPRDSADRRVLTPEAGPPKQPDVGAAD